MPTKREMLFVLVGAGVAIALAVASGRMSLSRPPDAPVVVLETMHVVPSRDAGPSASSDAGGNTDAGLQESTKVVRDAGAAAHLDAGRADAGIDAGK